ncbi:hypothetical protein [Sporomusa termitida]|uniref:Uncharacterized protein n=1 Tax=Sporomusa termitida TaxID=2377 RepID=A0A517DTA7_9FIRM|nr:hypothetical protein [Sporomusa termitida]QDR80579.1 hypothetical protein SPTER_19080 [Sporomusa termitida]
MLERPRWWSFLHPDLTARLLLVIGFLLVVAIGYAFGVYDGAAQGNLPAAFNASVALLLYAVPAIGLLKLKRWARIVELILSFIFVIIGFIVMFGYNMTMGVMIIVPHGLIGMYLLSDDCRRAFGLISKA